MTTEIHPTAVVDDRAELGAGVVLGPHAVVGPGVEIGDRCRLDAGAIVQGPTRLGTGNRVHSGACIGFDPQDLKFEGEETRLEVGDDNQFREHVTVHRGTGHGGGLTRIGSGNLLMVGAHVAHDCMVGDHTIFANQGTLAGHVEVGDHAVIGAFSSVHQFCRVGAYAYIGGYSVVTRDALPFVKTVGAKPACYGLNTIGLERRGFGPETLKALQRAYRILVRSGLPRDRATEKIRAEIDGGDLPANAHLEAFLAFVTSSQRGVITDPPGRKRGGRGG
ncbi:MAG: acyl-ACP--UDP-N-acetylglucosamine O-acyltransferase [Acidobacteriota bacterium]